MPNIFFWRRKRPSEVMAAERGSVQQPVFATVSNDTTTEILLVIEPFAECYPLPTGKVAVLVSDPPVPAGQVDILLRANEVEVWGPSFTKVYCDDRLMRPLPQLDVEKK